MVRPGSTAWRQPQQFLENPSRTVPCTNIASVLKNFFCKFVFVDFLAALGLHCCMAFSNCGAQTSHCGVSSVVEHGL